MTNKRSYKGGRRRDGGFLALRRYSKGYLHLGFTSSDHRDLFVGNIVNVLKSMERPDDAESVRQAFYRVEDVEEALFDMAEAPAAGGFVTEADEPYDPYEP